MNEPVETTRDFADITQAQLLQNLMPSPRTLDLGAPLPPLFHWLQFPTNTMLAELGNDGHPKRASDGPGADLPRRMWAGSTVDFIAPVNHGAELDRKSWIDNATEKTGKSGRLCFVTIKHEIISDGRLALTESQQIVYREAPKAGEKINENGVTRDYEKTATITPGPVMLFRYSALTFNGHRIHYDRTYATQQEGYDGLVVHGPLIATMLLDMALRHQNFREPGRFSFKAKAPLFDTQPFEICLGPIGDETEMWALSPSGQMAMEAKVVFK